MELVATPSGGGSGRAERVDAPDARLGFFTHRVQVDDLYGGMVDVARLYGFAGVEPNTVLVGWPRHNRAPDRFHRALDSMADMDLNVLVLDHDAERDYGSFKTIDIWLEGGGRNASLALALVRFLTSADPWRRAELRFLKWHEGESAFAGALRDSIHGLLEAQRLSASVQVVQATPGETFAEAVRRESGTADLTLIGLPKAGRLSSEGFVRQTNEIIDTIGTVLLLRASNSFEELTVGDFAEEARLLPRTDLGEVEETDAASLVTDDAALRAEVGRLQTTLRAIAAEVQAEIAVAEGLGGTLVADTVDLVRSTFSSLERSFPTADAPRRVRAVDRETARLLFRGREILAGARGDTLLSQARTLTSGTGLAARTLENLPSKLPARLGGVGKGHGRAVRLRSAFEDGLLVGLLEHLVDTLHRFDRRAAARVDAAVRLQAALADALDRLTAEPDAPEPEARRMLEAERATLGALEEALMAELDDARGVDVRAITEGVSELLADWVRELGRNQGRMPRRPGARADEILDRLRDAGDAWSSHQVLRLSDAELGIRLRGSRHRMGIVLDRAIQDIRIETDTTARGLKALEGLVAERSRTPAEGPLSLPDVHSAFDGHAVVTQIVDELRAAVSDLPEEWDVHVQTAGTEVHDVLEAVETRRISPRTNVDYRLQTTLVTPLEPRLLALGAACVRGVETAHEVTRLVRYASTEEMQPGMEGSLQSILARSSARLVEARERITEAMEAVATTAGAGLRGVEPHLVTTAVTAMGAGSESRSPSGSRWLSSAGLLVDRARASLVRRLVGMWYRRSRGVILGERLRAGERAGRSSVDRLLTLVESVSPEPEAMADLPFYYRQLFLEHAAATRDFWIPRPRSEAQFKRALERFRLGHEGGLLVVGDPGSGRSSLIARMTQRQVRAPVLRVSPPPHATSDVATFDRHLATALGVEDATEVSLGQLPVGSVVVVDDVGLWWERRDGGLEVVQRILKLIDRFGGRCLFVLTATPATERLLQQLVRFEDRFLASVHLEPLSAEALRDIVLVRHRSTGMGLAIDGRATQGPTDWRVARFFNQLFDRTHGNVGESLQAWIACIRAVEGDEIQVTSADPPRLTAIQDLGPRQRALVASLAVHGAVSLDSLLGSMGLDRNDFDTDVAALRRCGLVEESGGALRLNRYVEPYLRRDLQTQGVI